MKLWSTIKIMQHNEIIEKYFKKIVNQDFEQKNNYYPNEYNGSVRIYLDPDSSKKRNMNFGVHIYDHNYSIVKLLYQSRLSIYVSNISILIADENQKYEVRTSDEYFNISLSLDLNIPFSTLKNIQNDMLYINRKSITFFMDELIEHFNKVTEGDSGS